MSIQIERTATVTVPNVETSDEAYAVALAELTAEFPLDVPGYLSESVERDGYRLIFSLNS